VSVYRTQGLVVCICVIRVPVSVGSRDNGRCCVCLCVVWVCRLYWVYISYETVCCLATVTKLSKSAVLYLGKRRNSIGWWWPHTVYVWPVCGLSMSTCVVCVGRRVHSEASSCECQVVWWITDVVRWHSVQWTVAAAAWRQQGKWTRHWLDWCTSLSLSLCQSLLLLM